MRRRWRRRISHSRIRRIVRVRVVLMSGIMLHRMVPVGRRRSVCYTVMRAGGMVGGRRWMRVRVRRAIDGEGGIHPGLRVRGWRSRVLVLDRRWQSVLMGRRRRGRLRLRVCLRLRCRCRRRCRCDISSRSRAVVGRLCRLSACSAGGRGVVGRASRLSLGTGCRLARCGGGSTGRAGRGRLVRGSGGGSSGRVRLLLGALR